MKDKIMTCIQCGNTFVFTASEQARFIAHRFDKPKRCQEYRKKNRERLRSVKAGTRTRKGKVGEEMDTIFNYS